MGETVDSECVEKICQEVDRIRAERIKGHRAALKELAAEYHENMTIQCDRFWDLVKVKPEQATTFREGVDALQQEFSDKFAKQGEAFTEIWKTGVPTLLKKALEWEKQQAARGEKRSRPEPSSKSNPKKAGASSGGGGEDEDDMQNKERPRGMERLTGIKRKRAKLFESVYFSKFDSESDVEMEKDEQEEDATYVPDQDDYDDDEDEDEDDVETEDAVSDAEQSTGTGRAPPSAPPISAPVAQRPNIGLRAVQCNVGPRSKTRWGWEEDSLLINICKEHGRFRKVPISEKSGFWERYGVPGRTASACVNRVKNLRDSGRIQDSWLEGPISEKTKRGD